MIVVERMLRDGTTVRYDCDTDARALSGMIADIRRHRIENTDRNWTRADQQALVTDALRQFRRGVDSGVGRLWRDGVAVTATR